ncbi:MAG: type II secretion system minor pseudopilin GspH [Parasphingorhabdus sp.]
MRKSLTLDRPDRDQAGFTLVELLIVIGILGLLTSLVVLSLPGGSGALEQDAQRFAARTAALRDNAILQSRPMAVQVTASGYSFLQRRDGRWAMLEDKPFTSTNWSPGVSPEMDEAGSMIISFESTGLPSEAIKIDLQFEEKLRRIVIAPMGDVKLAGALP